MRVIAFETTCDETSVAVLDGRRLLSNVVFSQIKLHSPYRGVVPELASRAHLEKISGVLSSALSGAGYKSPLFRNGRFNGPDVAAIAFSRGPGLPGALMVGRVAAETLARLSGARLIGVNHLEGHLLACELSGKKILRRLSFPCIALIVSGGHTELWHVTGYGRYRVLGRTRDDAAGEAFDKVAKLLGLPYPGGPSVERAASGHGAADFELPRPYMKGTNDFSFSGLKTAVSYRLAERLGTDFYVSGKRLPRSEITGLCRAFQDSVVETLLHKTVSAAGSMGIRDIVVGGGVSANGALRKKFMGLKGYRVLFPEKEYSTDNAAMIALCAMRRLETPGFKEGPVDIAPDLEAVSWC